MSKIKVGITDDHPLILDGIRDVVEAIDTAEIVGAWLDARTTREALSEISVDVLFLDINLPDGDGIELCKEFSKDFPTLKIIALTTYSQTIMVKQMMKNGASGYLLKNTSHEEIAKAIESVMAGKQYLQSEIKELLLADSIGNPIRQSFIPRLTRREKEVLELVCAEFTTTEIGEKLFISPKTVESHRLNLMQKLGVRNTAGLVKAAINKGLLE